MQVKYAKSFKKQYKKLPIKIQLRFDERLKLFMTDPAALELNVHPLKGNYAGYWSMNVSGDFRALYLKQGDDIVIFALIGTHSQLYG